MRRIMGKLQQALSIILTVAMVITCIPQTGLTAFAAELDTIESTDLVDMEEDVELEVSDSTEDTGNTASDDQEDVEGNTSDDTDDIDSETPGDGEDTETEVPDSSEQPDTDEEQETPEENQEELDDGLLSEEETEGPLEEDISVSENMILDGAGETATRSFTIGQGGQVRAKGSKSSYSDKPTAFPIEYTPEDETDTNYYFEVKPNDHYVILTVQTRDANFIIKQLSPEGTVQDGEGTWYSYSVSKDMTSTIAVTFALAKYNITVKSDSEIVDFTPTGNLTGTENQYTAEATKSMQFSLKVKDALKDQYTIEKVEYKCGNDTKELEPDNSGSYTSPAVTGDAEIIVTMGVYVTFISDENAVTLIKDISVTGGKAPEMIEFRDLTENGETKGQAKLPVTQNSQLKFKLAAEPYYIIEGIQPITTEEETEEEIIAPDATGLYTIDKVTEATTYRVVSKAIGDENGYYSLLFESGEGSVAPEIGIDVKLPGKTKDRDTISVQGRKSIGESITTKNQQWTVSITVPDEYVVKKVLLNGKESAPSSGFEKNKDGTYAITLTPLSADNRQQDKLTITTERKKKVTFKNSSTHLKYEIVKDGGLEGTKIINEYTIPEGTEIVKFKVTIAEAYEPKVTANAEECTPNDTVAELKKSKEKQYTYEIKEEDLDLDNTIDLGEEKIGTTLKVDYGKGNSNDVVAVVSVDGEEWTKEKATEDLGYWEYKDIPLNAAVTVKVTSQRNCSFDSLVNEVESNGKTKVTKKKASNVTKEVLYREIWKSEGVYDYKYVKMTFRTAEIKVTAARETTVKIEEVAKKYERQPVWNDTDLNIYPTKDNIYLDTNNVYSVREDGCYKMAIHYGNNFDLKNPGNVDCKDMLLRVEAVVGKNQVIKDDSIVKLTSDGKDAIIEAGKLAPYAGQSVKINLYTSRNGEELATTYILKVRNTVSKITVPTATQKQALDTKKEYKVSVNSGADVGRLSAEVISEKNSSGKDVDVVADVNVKVDAKGKGVVEVITGQDYGEAKIKVYATKRKADDSGNDKGGVEETEASAAILTINTIDLLDSKKAPQTLKLTNSDDTSLTFALTAKGIAEAQKGAVFYEVTAEARDKDAAESSTKNNTLLANKTVYVLKEEGNTQSYKLNLAVNGISSGKGIDRKYDVTVKLIHVADKDDVKENADGAYTITNKLGESKPKTVKNCATKKAAWETALKLKKVTTTVYTGQKDIIIAIPQFSKATTHTEWDPKTTNFTVEDITEGIDFEKTTPNNGALVVTVEDDGAGNPVIKAQAGDPATANAKEWPPTKLGKHKIKVSAHTPNNMYASSVTMDVTVVQSITDCKIQLPSATIYKADKKAATLKPTVLYNPGSVAPKTKKMKWTVRRLKGANSGVSGETIYDYPAVLEENDPLYGMYTINQSNGTLTIKKDFVVPKDSENYKYVLYADARDWTYTRKGDGIDLKKGGDAAYTDMYEKYCAFPRNSGFYTEGFTITNEGADICGTAIVAPTTTQKAQYEIICINPDIKNNAKNAELIAASKLKNAQIVALNSAGKLAYSNGELKPGTILDKNSTYKKENDKNVLVTIGLDYYIYDTAKLSFKSGSAKNIAVDKDGQITVNKPVNTKLTVTANDGSKKKAELTVKVGYDSVSELDLSLKQFSGHYKYISSDRNLRPGEVLGYNPIFKEPLYDPTQRTSENTKPTYDKKEVLTAMTTEKSFEYSPYFDIKVQYKDNTGGWADVSSSMKPNYTLTVTGGKKLETSTGTRIVVTSKTATITLTDKISKVKHIYKLTDKNSVSDKSSLLTKKPSIKVIKNFHAVATKEQQTAELQIANDAVWKAFSDQCEKSGTKPYARVELDWTAMNQKNEETLRTIGQQMFGAVETQMEGNRYLLITDTDRTFSIQADDINLVTKDVIEMTPGSYKLKVTLGVMGGEDNKTFIQQSAAANVTVKVDKAQKMTFKPTTSYTIGTRDGRGVYLTGTSNIKDRTHYMVTYGNLRNANIKGQANEFINFFEITTDSTDPEKQQIRLKDKTEDGKPILFSDVTNKPINNFIGYVDYEMQANREYYKSNINIKDGKNLGTIKGTFKITIKLDNKENKAVAKYTLSGSDGNNVIAKPAISNLQGSKIQLYLTVGGYPVNMKCAYFEPKTTDVDWKPELVTKNKNDEDNPYKRAFQTMQLTLNKDAKSGTKTGTLWVVPEDSYYIDKFTDQNKQVLDNISPETYKQYATPVKVSITLKDTLKETQTAITNWSKNIHKEKPEWLYNGTTKEKVIEAINNDVKPDDRIAIVNTDVETKQLATDVKTGSLKVTLQLKSTQSDTVLTTPVTVAFTITIPAGKTQAPTPDTPDPVTQAMLNPAVLEETESAA